MKRYGMALLGSLAFLFAACSNQQAGPGPQEIVVTEGLPTPKGSASSPLKPQGQLRVDPLVVGSQTTPLAVNGCPDGQASTVQLSYSIQTPPPQSYPASFQVYTTWIYQGGTWAGSDPVTVTFNGTNDPPKTVTLTVRNGPAPATGSSSFEVNPFNPQPSTGQGHLQISSQGKATVHVAFTPCPAPPANTPPTLTVPQYVLQEATSPNGATVTFQVLAWDQEDGDLSSSVLCTPASGSLFPIGETQVACSVTDSGGASAQATFPVYVEDSTPPVFSGVPGSPVERIAQNRQGWALSLAELGLSASDPGGVSEPVSVTCEPEKGSYIPIGATQTVVCTARDSASYRAPVSQAPPPPNESQATFTVHITLEVDPAGFLPPLRMSLPYSSHKRGSTLPHKLYPPRYADGTPATDLAEGLRLVLYPLGSCEAEPSTSIEGNESSTGSTAWRYDPDSGQYIFNLKTQSAWNLGCYRTRVSYAGIQLAETYFNLAR